MATFTTAGLENRALSSLLISNIHHDMTEKELRDLFAEVGPVVNFKLFYDQDGKSKGVAFCEFKDTDIAITAIRTLSGLNLKGQPLCIDMAATEKSMQELQRLQETSVEERSGEGTDSATEKAPEEISKAVASLPAEQMFELMKQMKMCVENNPQEARALLLQNPQLAYALLQAQVIMRIVDPEVALKILNRPASMAVATGNLNPDARINTDVSGVPPSELDVSTSFSVGSANAPTAAPSSVPRGAVPTHQARPLAERSLNPSVLPAVSNPFGDQDLRTLDQDLRQIPVGDHDMRVPPMGHGDKDLRQPLMDQDFRTLPAPAAVPDRPFDPRFRGMPENDANRPTASSFERSRSGNVDPRTAYDSRSGVSGLTRLEDPRKAANARMGSSATPLVSVGGLSLGAMPGGPGGAPPDQERAALIMQVLQLSDQQIAMLPPEQRQSIMVLKEQIARSQMS